MLEAAIQQFYELRARAARDPRAGRSPTSARRSRAWLSERAGRRVRIVVPQRGEKRGAGRSREPQRRARVPDALQPGDRGAVRRARDAAGTCWRCRRCRAASSASTSRRSRAARRSRRWSSARTAACGGASIGSSGSGARELGARDSEIRTPSLRAPEPRAAGSDDDFAAMHEVVLRRYRDAARARRAVSRSDPDRRRQGAAVGGVRGARGARPREPRRGRHREEGGAALHARPRRSDRARRATIRRCCSSSGSATRRIASR